MTFLNGLLAFGAIAAVLPLAIHLLNRQRFETIDWAAMHLIAAVHHLNQRRWRWQELLLLLVRCAIPILLALALARPVLTAWRAAGGGQPSTTIVLLDDSASMQRNLPTGGSAFDEARRRIALALNQSAAGSEANIVLAGGKFENVADVATTDLDGLLDSLHRIDASTGSLDLRGAGQSVMNQLANATNPWRRLLILSDFADEDWQAGGNELASQFEEAFADLPRRPDVTLLPIHADPTAPNIAVTSLDSPVQHAVAGQEVAFTAIISRRGAPADTAVKGHWSVNGVRQASMQPTMQADELISLDWTFAFAEPGTHRIRFEIETDDAFPVDNHRDWVVFTDTTTQVLLVDGNPSDQPLAGEADFLSIALSPFVFARDERIDAVRTRVVEANSVNAESLESVDVVVLANVRELDQQRTEQLIKFVASGGHLAIFLGDRINVDWYNRFLEGTSGNALLPIRVKPQAVDAEPPLELEAIGESEVLQPLIEVAGRRFEGVDVRRYHEIEWIDGDGERSRPNVLVRLSNGEPYLVQDRWGNGALSLAVGPADADWSNLPTRPVFLPLVQNLLGRKGLGLDRALNVPSGGSLVDYFDAKPDEAPATAEIRSADGEIAEAQIDSIGRFVRVRSAPLRGAGPWTIQYGDAPKHLASVSLPASESRFTPLSDQQLEALAKSFGGSLVTEAEALEELGRERRFGREVWRWLLAAVTLLLLLEVFLQQHIRRLNRPVGALC